MRMHKLTIMLGKVFESDSWGIAFCSPTAGGFSFHCKPCEDTKPFYGKVFSDDEIKQLIQFLEQTLKEEGSDEGAK